MDVVGIFFSFYFVVLLMGLPALAIALRRDRLSLLEAGVDAPLVGILLVSVLIPILLCFQMFAKEYVSWSLGLLAAGLWTYVLVCRRFKIIWGLPQKYLASIMAFAFLFFVACLFRQGTSNFLYLVGDMGQYVNDANRLVKVHRLGQGFPHMFTAFLALSHMFFGVAGTVNIVPFFGLMAALCLCAIIVRQGFDRKTILFVAVMALLDLLPVWFSKFPASEILYALQVVTFFYFLSTCLEQKSKVYGILAALTVFSLGLTRVNGLLFAVLSMIWLFVPFVKNRQNNLSLYCTTAAALACAVFLAYFYNISFIPNYYIATQMRTALGGNFEQLESFGLFDAGSALFAAFGCGLILYMAAFFGLARFGDRVGKYLRHTLLVVFLLLICLVLRGPLAGFSWALNSFNHLLVFFAGCGLALFLYRWKKDESILLGLVAFIGLVFSVHFCHAVDEPTPHAFYLYYFRYIFSEVYWCALIFAAVGFETLQIYLAKVRPNSSRWMVNSFLIASILFVANDSYRLSGRSLYEGSFEQIQWLDETMSDRGKPIFFAGLDPERQIKPPGWFYPNMWRAYAEPLDRSFSRRIETLEMNRSLTPFGRDPAINFEQIKMAMKKKNQAAAYLFTASGPSPTPVPENLWNNETGAEQGVAWKLMDTNTTPVAFLRQGRGVSKRQNFGYYLIKTNVYEISLEE
ncbi:MAG: hypothetical protein AB7T49_01390 [Oligoflexales bacterium]